MPHPPSPLAWDAVAPALDTEPAAIPDNALNTPLATSTPLEDNDAPDGTRSTPATSYFCPQERPPSSPRLVESANVGESGQDRDHRTLSLVVGSLSPTAVPSNEENTSRVICNDRQDEAKEDMDEVEDDHAPSPPAIIAASFEAAKSRLTEDGEDLNLSSLEEFASPTYVPFEDSITRHAVRNDMHSEEEDQMDRVEEDRAPSPPETTAASFEAVKPEHTEDVNHPPSSDRTIASLIECSGREGTRAEFEDDATSPEAVTRDFIGDVAPPPPEMIAALFEEHVSDEAKWEEVDDNDAPAPPEMIAASFEANANVNQGEKQNLEIADDNMINSNGTFVPEIVNNEQMPTVTESQGHIVDAPYSSNLQHSSSNHDQAGAFTVTSSHPVDNDLIFPAIGQDQIGIAFNPDLGPELRQVHDLSRQSIPLPEATPVHEVPEEPVYDAVPIDPTQGNDSQGWSRRVQKYKAILLGLVSVTTGAIIATAIALSNNESVQTGTNIADPSDWYKQGQTVVGDSASDYLGHSVSLSSDAKTLVIGAPGYLGNTDRKGYVKVYYRQDGEGAKWEPLGQTIIGTSSGDLFGFSVDINANGTILAIGSPGYSDVTDGPGYVRSFNLEGSNDQGFVWTQLGKDIFGEAVDDEFGISVSLSADGDTLAVGAWLNDGFGDVYPGHVRIFTLQEEDSTWVQIGDDIDVVDEKKAHAYSGAPTALSSDGKTVAIASWYGDENGNNSGFVRVYKIFKDEWEKLGQTISGYEYDTLGSGLDISADGSILAIGAPRYGTNDRPGYVKVYRLESSNDQGFVWTQLGHDIFGEAIGDEFGISLSLSGDGNTLAVGGWKNDGFYGENSGHVRIYSFKNDDFTWVPIGAEIDGEAAGDFSGFSLSLSANGESVAIGSYGSDSNGVDSGNVRVYAKINDGKTDQ